MLPKSAYQTIAACMLYDSDMSKAQKLRILEFIEKASSKQILHYLIHDEFVREGETRLVNEGFILTAALITAASAAGRAVYSKFNSVGQQACRDKLGLAKSACLKNYKARGVAGKVSALRKEMGKCSQTPKPEKCRKMFIKYIRNAEKEMRKIQSQ